MSRAVWVYTEADGPKWTNATCCKVT